MNGRSYTFVGLVQCEFSLGDLYACTSHIAEAEVDILSLGPSWSKRSRTNFSNCDMTNGHMIVGSSAHESQERETIMFCSQQVTRR